MQDDYYTPQRQVLKRRSGGGKALLGGLLLALVGIGGAAGWLVYTGRMQVNADIEGIRFKSEEPKALPAPAPGASPAAPAPAILEQRLTAMEQRLAQLDVAADAASSNAARAEGLLVAFAARRAVERGLPLGYLEPQLKLRFGEAQPAAVAQLIEAGHKPVTRDQLLAQLDALAPTLEDRPSSESGWARIQREVSSLFIVRRDDHQAPRATDRLERARLMVQSGRIEQAAEEVSGLPGAGAASEWLAAARRYAAAQRALDAVETTALLEPRGLQDAKGQEVERPSPLVSPGPEGSASPTPAAVPAGSPKPPAPRP